VAIKSTKSRNAARTRKIELREKLWPGVEDVHVWDRHNRDGFATVPRALPLMLSIMNRLGEKGQPLGPTYLELFCRLGDEAFLNLNRPQEMAFAAGFTGQRALYTWRERLATLRDLGFIDFKTGPSGEFSYGLFLNPYHVIRKHFEAGRVDDASWQALVFRAHEIGANDLDEELPPPPSAKKPNQVPVTRKGNRGK
jgi:hypothetical protein